MNQKSFAATVVAIKQNHWPTEWDYMIRTQKEGKQPQIIMAILDRGLLNMQGTSVRIKPQEIRLINGDTAFFFNKMEQPTRVTFIERGSPDFSTTARTITLRGPEELEDVLIENFESHHLFTANTNPLDTGKTEEETPEPASRAVMNWGPKTAWNLPRPDRLCPLLRRPSFGLGKLVSRLQSTT